ncbi:hypothetical protein C0Q70_01578 [Pomacea canaliculata]|uniref:Uncharacterized protein n=1 Tax=Pomacea canaliculata TaxID=400727 RepID=A0A2T7PZV3_POMCA|nr:hypothetical protein C0Q70_01578 [Pomacea canaliculata]
MELIEPSLYKCVLTVVAWKRRDANGFSRSDVRVFTVHGSAAGFHRDMSCQPVTLAKIDWCVATPAASRSHHACAWSQKTGCNTEVTTIPSVLTLPPPKHDQFIAAVPNDDYIPHLERSGSNPVAFERSRRSNEIHHASFPFLLLLIRSIEGNQGIGSRESGSQSLLLQPTYSRFRWITGMDRAFSGSTHRKPRQGNFMRDRSAQLCVCLLLGNTTFRMSHIDIQKPRFRFQGWSRRRETIGKVMSSKPLRHAFLCSEEKTI